MLVPKPRGRGTGGLAQDLRWRRKNKKSEMNVKMAAAINIRRIPYGEWHQRKFNFKIEYSLSMTSPNIVVEMVLASSSFREFKVRKFKTAFRVHSTTPSTINTAPLPFRTTLSCDRFSLVRQNTVAFTDKKLQLCPL